MRLAWLCGDHHLPDTGAMYDQDAGLLNKMRAAVNVYNTLSHYRNAKGKEIHTLSIGERKILRMLIDESLL